MNWYKLSQSEQKPQLFKEPNGIIRVTPNSQWAPENRNSIVEWVVDEGHRGKGIGKRLIDQVLSHENYSGKPMSAQVSSLASLKILYSKGFRNPDVGEVSFEEYIEAFKENWGSLCMRFN